ncbi:MAG: TetR family transcriptional regulator [Proteobacteria bacterium]|nr:TetR family transcriptional regulator [Pseudomonadota bacterium]
MRETAKNRTRQALIDAARYEFVDKGFDVPSLDAICARAGKTRGAFYVHFRDREDLVVAVIADTLGLLMDAVIASGAPESDLVTTITRYVKLAAGDLDEHGRTQARRTPGVVEFHQLLAACARSEAIREKFVSILREATQRLSDTVSAAQQAGHARADLPPDALAALLMVMALGVRIAADIALPLNVHKTQDAALRLIEAKEAD